MNLDPKIIVVVLSIISLLITIIATLITFAGVIFLLKFQTNQNKRDNTTLKTEVKDLREKIDKSSSKIYTKIDENINRVVDKLDEFKVHFVSKDSCTNNHKKGD